MEEKSQKNMYNCHARAKGYDGQANNKLWERKGEVKPNQGSGKLGKEEQWEDDHLVRVCNWKRSFWVGC